MKELEKIFRKKTIVAALICMVIGIILMVLELHSFFSFGNVQDLDNINPIEIKEGPAKATVYDVYDYYSFWTDSTGKEVKRDYFISVGNEQKAVYIGCELTGRKNDRAYDIMEAIWAAEDSGEEVDFDTIDYFRVRGTVKEITGEDLQYYKEYLRQLADYFDLSDAEINDCFVPYVLVTPTVGDGGTMSYLIAIVGVILLIVAIGLVFDALFGNPLKEIRKYCKNSANEELEMAKIERFCTSTPERYGIKVNDEYFLFLGGYRPQIYSTKNVIWFYKYIVTRKSYFITVGRDYYIRFRTADGKMVQCATKKDEADQVLNYFMNVMPDSIAGYDDNLERMYQQNRGQMIAEVERKHDERTGNACMHDDSEKYNSTQDYNY